MGVTAGTMGRNSSGINRALYLIALVVILPFVSLCTLQLVLLHIMRAHTIICVVLCVHCNCNILTTNLAAVVCVDVCQCAKFDQFLPERSHFESKRSEKFVRIAKFPYGHTLPLDRFLRSSVLYFLRETMI